VTAPTASHRTGRSRGGRGRAAADRAELHDAVRQAAIVATVGFGAFVFLDVYLHALLFPDSHLGRLLGLRAAGTLVLVGFLVWSRGADRSRTALVAATSCAFAVSCAFMAILGGELGGLDTDYTYGLAFFYGGTAAVIPSPWRRTLVLLIPAHIAFFSALAIVVTIDPHWSWQWHEQGALAELGVGLLFTTALLAFSSVSGQLLWASRKQLYEARRLGRYRLTSPLGEGGMNEVWLARDDALRRDVALKVLRAAPGIGDDRWVRFEREAQVASTLTSPHTIKIFDYGASDDGIAYIAMEHLRGLDLDAMVDTWGPLAIGRAIHYTRQACLSLAEAHERGLVHRDVKPGNLFALSSAGEEDFLKVLDFGVVRELGAPAADLTSEGVMVGTPVFMAPEQFTGGDVTPASDVYALGATLYFMLTATPPFDVQGDTKLWRAHTAAPVVPPSLRRGEPVPAALEAVVARCLAKHPVDRYVDCRALLGALDDLGDDGLEPWTRVEAQRWWTEARLAPRHQRHPTPSAVSLRARGPSRPPPAGPAAAS